MARTSRVFYYGSLEQWLVCKTLNLETWVRIPYELLYNL